MKVTAKWQYYKGQPWELKQTSISFCCLDAELSKAIIFGDVDEILNRDPNMNIYSCNPYPEGPVWNEEAIQFCPFCGAKIEIEIITKEEGK